jgi:hypothetical protein
LYSQVHSLRLIHNVYVGPFAGPPAGDEEFWNAPFGAYATIADVATAAGALTFFLQGNRLLGRP